MAGLALSAPPFSLSASACNRRRRLQCRRQTVSASTAMSATQSALTRTSNRYRLRSTPTSARPPSTALQSSDERGSRCSVNQMADESVGEPPSDALNKQLENIKLK